MGYWSDWSIPILVTTAAGFTYITVLLVSRIKCRFLEVCAFVLRRVWNFQSTYDLSNSPFRSDFSLPLSLSLKLPKINRKWKPCGLWPQTIKSGDGDPDTGGAAGLRRNTAFVSLSMAPAPLWCVCQSQVQVVSPHPRVLGPSRWCPLRQHASTWPPCNQCFLMSWTRFSNSEPLGGPVFPSMALALERIYLYRWAKCCLLDPALLSALACWVVFWGGGVFLHVQTLDGCGVLLSDSWFLLLQILALCHIAVGQQMNLHWLHKVNGSSQLGKEQGLNKTGV